MKRLFSILIFLVLLTVQAWAQRLTVTAHIEDSFTGEALPYVSVYVANNNTTISNAEGDFTIQADSLDNIRISYVGYKPLNFKACELPKVIQMETTERTLHQLTVLPVESILMNTVTKLNKEYNKKDNKKAKYFFRMTSQIQNKDELMEAFLESNSAVNLRNLSIISGRRGQMTKWGMIRPTLKDINLQHALEAGPMIRDILFWRNHTLPLQTNAKPSYFSKLYSITCEEMMDSIEGKVYVMNMQKGDGVKNKNYLVGKLFIKASNFQLLRYEGEVTDMILDVKRNGITVSRPVKMTINVKYTTANGFTEVEDLSCDISAEELHTQTILHNISNLNIKVKKPKEVKENLLSAMDNAGFDSTLWKHAGIIQRTSYEEKLARQQAVIKIEQQEQHIGNDHLDKMVDRLRLFGLRIPQEKVFLHLDNTCYFIGDTIWFAAYARRTNDGQPSDISNVMYAELLNHDGYVLERKLIHLKDGRGWGNFYLDPDYYSGFYEIRAYTRWQLNWGAYEKEHGYIATRDWFTSDDKMHEFFRDYDKLYSRVVPVYNQPNDPQTFFHDMTLRPMSRYFKKDPDRKRKLLLNFYPEGGELVEGLPCRVAYEATYEDGEWLDGTLELEDGRSIPTVHRGRGVFTITPQKGDLPKVSFKAKKGEVIKGKWPKVQKNGVALEVTLGDDSQWRFKVQHTPDILADSLAITVMHEGVLSHVWALKTKEQGEQSEFKVLDMELKTGVNQVTLFDTEGRVLADRLFFVNHTEDTQPNITISGLRDEYRPFEKITLNVKADQPSLAKGQPISITVRDSWNQDYLYDTGSMFTEMLLSSEIRGFIPQPEWYFEANDNEHNQALDLLMMTQGWRRFSWREMAVPGEWDLVHPDEKNIVVEGVVNGYISEEHILENQIAAAGLPNDAPPSLSENGGTTAASTRELSTKDLQDLYGKSKRREPKELTVHAELVDGNTLKPIASELTTQNHRFRLKLPDFYNDAYFFLSAADTSKWKGKKNYAWIQLARNIEDMPADHSMRAEWERQSEDPDYMPYVSEHYPRYATPYAWHQKNLAPAPKFEGTRGRRFSDGTTELNEVAVTAKRNGRRRFQDSEPAFMIDAYDAYNHALDAGLRPTPENIVRSYLGDYGLDNPYASNETGGGRSSRIEVRYGATTERRFDTTGLTSQQMDSLANEGKEDELFRRTNLQSMGQNVEDMSPGELKQYYNTDDHQQVRVGDFNFFKLDKFVIYTDYAPRHYGDDRYVGSNLPYTYIVAYPLPNDGRRVFYRDRRYVVHGFSYCENFYSPDYSNRKLPEPTEDRRRTLYWNPDLKLDSNGQATVTLYNCGRQSAVTVSAEGITSEGQFLTGKADGQFQNKQNTQSNP